MSEKFLMTKFTLGLVVCGLLMLTACSSTTTPTVPKITGFTPAEGPVGTEVTINGEGFGATAAENTVKFAEAVTPTTGITFASATEIKAIVPEGAKTGVISVTTSKGTGSSEKEFIVKAPPTVAAAKWTFLVYLDADNNLERAGIQDFFEMAAIGSSPEVNIVVQMDRVPGEDSSNGDWKDTRRFFIKKDDNPSMTPLQELGEKNMGDPKVLQDFVEWGVKNYPAEHYAVVIWNHGDGWRDLRVRMMTKSRSALTPGGPDGSVTRAVASDDTDKDVLYMKEVQTALQDAKNNLKEQLDTFDIVAFDACFMGMVEVAYALRDVTGCVVGSENTEPGNGWPYDKILQPLTATPALSAKDLAGIIVTEYVNSYPGSSGITQSAVDISKLNHLVDKINAFTAKATAEWPVLKTARQNARQYHPQWYKSFWSVDLGDFADKVHGQAASADIKTAALDLKNAVNDFVIKEAHGSDMAGSTGIAIYFPPDKAAFDDDPSHTGYLESNTYMPVDFVTNEKWDNWLLDFYANIP